MKEKEAAARVGCQGEAAPMVMWHVVKQALPEAYCAPKHDPARAQLQGEEYLGQTVSGSTTGQTLAEQLQPTMLSQKRKHHNKHTLTVRFHPHQQHCIAQPSSKRSRQQCSPAFQTSLMAPGVPTRGMLRMRPTAEVEAMGLVGSGFPSASLLGLLLLMPGWYS